jgi:hypothetical protein
MPDVIGRFVAELSAPLPAGWFAKETITLLAPDGQGNVIASSEPLDVSIDTARYAAVQGALLRKEFPQFHETALTEEPVLGGRRGLLRRFEWTPPDGRRVRQLQFYFASGGRGYTATATSSRDEFERFELAFRQILRGISMSERADASIARPPDGAD